MLTLAYATSIEQFLNDAILNEVCAERFPGASVWPVAKKVAMSRGWDFATADIVLERVRSGEVQASDVRVIQEEDSALGAALIGAGAHASLLLCGESPLFARDFYRRLDERSQGFDNAVLFRGALGKVASPTQGHVLHFPGFHRGAHVDIQSWQNRKTAVMVAGNKYWHHAGLPIARRLRSRVQRLRDRRYFEWLGQHQLHDRRLEYVVDLSKAGVLNLYGPGWNSFHHLPVRWRGPLGRANIQGLGLDYAQKHSTIGGFKFSLTMENFEYPGYVTEKIIDAIAAGTIPLYLGAPDIDDFIPPDVFVDLRLFSSSRELVRHITTMDEATGLAMIERGQEFLSSADGDKYSFEYQGELIVDIVGR